MFTRILIDALSIHTDRVLVSDKSRSLTGADMRVQTNNIAANLLKLGITPGDRVGIAMRDQVNAFLVFIAVFRVGAVPAFMDFRMKVAVKSRLIESFDLVALIDDGQSVDFHQNAQAFDRLWLDEMADNDIYFAQPEKSSGYLAISSGTTGLPKAYAVDNTVLSARINETMPFDPKDHSFLLITMPLAYAGSHDMLFTGIANGIEVHIMPIVFSVKQLANTMREKRASGTFLPPAIIHNLLQEEYSSEPAFPDLKVLKSGGSSLIADKVVESFHRITHGFTMSYGASVSGAVSCLQGDALLRHPGSCGTLNKNVKVEVLDRETREILPVGKEGILRISSPSVVGEIISAAPSTEEASAGWCITGDIGYVDDDGFLYITGRLSDVIIRAGISISPLEIEKVLVSHPSIDDAVVIGVEDDRVGHEILAVIVAPSLTVADVKQHIMQVIDQDKRPRHMQLVEALPYNNNGKLDRNAAQKMFS